MGEFIFADSFIQSEKIIWLPITTWEYIGEDSNFSYLLDLYEDFEDAKIDEKKIFNTRKSDYQIISYFLSSDCTVAKLKISSKDKEDSKIIILFLRDEVLYEGQI